VKATAGGVVIVARRGGLAYEINVPKGQVSVLARKLRRPRRAKVVKERK
jgi:hypothetical protein